MNVKALDNLFNLLKDSPDHLELILDPPLPKQVGCWDITKLENPGKLMTDPHGGELVEYDDSYMTHTHQIGEGCFEMFFQKKNDLDLFRIEISERKDNPEVNP